MIFIIKLVYEIALISFFIVRQIVVQLLMLLPIVEAIIGGSALFIFSRKFRRKYVFSSMLFLKRCFKLYVWKSSFRRLIYDLRNRFSYKDDVPSFVVWQVPKLSITFFLKRNFDASNSGGKSQYSHVMVPLAAASASIFVYTLTFLPFFVSFLSNYVADESQRLMIIKGFTEVLLIGLFPIIVVPVILFFVIRVEVFRGKENFFSTTKSNEKYVSTVEFLHNSVFVVPGSYVRNNSRFLFLFIRNIVSPLNYYGSEIFYKKLPNYSLTINDLANFLMFHSGFNMTSSRQKKEGSEQEGGAKGSDPDYDYGLVKWFINFCYPVWASYLSLLFYTIAFYDSVYIEKSCYLYAISTWIIYSVYFILREYRSIGNFKTQFFSGNFVFFPKNLDHEVFQVFLWSESGSVSKWLLRSLALVQTAFLVTYLVALQVLQSG